LVENGKGPAFGGASQPETEAPGGGASDRY